MDTAALLARVAFSLAVVVGLMWACAVVLRGRQRSTRTSASLTVVSRVPVGKHSSVAVLAVADRHLVVGVTAERISVLADLPAPQEQLTSPGSIEPRRTTIVLPATPTTTTDATVTTNVATPATAGPLTGSILSPTTWRQTVDVLRERTVRR